MLMLKEGPVGVCCSGQVQLLSLSPSIVGDTRRRIELAMHARSKNGQSQLCSPAVAVHVMSITSKQDSRKKRDLTSRLGITRFARFGGGNMHAGPAKQLSQTK